METPRTLFHTSQIIIYRCQRQLQILHVQPEVFIQEPSNFGFDQKPQIGVNISLATFYDIYILHVSSWSDDIASVLQATTAASSPPQPQVQQQLKGEERHTATVGPKSEEGVFMHPGQASLFFSLFGITVSPRCLQIMYISSYSSERMRFQFFKGARRWRERRPQTADYLKTLQADFEIFENNLFGNSKSQIGHLAKVTCPSVQRLQLMGHIVPCSQATEAASCWRTLCGLPV